MHRSHSRHFHRIVLLAIFIVAGLFAPIVTPTLIHAHQDTPAAECDSGPNVVCPDPDDPASQYIASITAVPDGIVILLTEDGITAARECDGPEAIARMSEALYATIPTTTKAEFQLDWTDQTLIDEIYGHAFLNDLSGEFGGLGSIYERSNPINIVFADYGGPGDMTAAAQMEQTVFQALGAAHRLAC